MTAKAGAISTCPCLLLLLSILWIGIDAGWSSLAARRAHNPKVVGSNPTPATKRAPLRGFLTLGWYEKWGL